MIGKKIHITNVCPGPVKTQVSENALKADGSKYGRTEPLTSNGMATERYMCAWVHVRGCVAV